MSLRSTMFEATCIVQRATVGRDLAQGKTSDPFVTIMGTTQPGGSVLGVPCSIQQAGTSLRELYGQRNTIVDAVIYFDVPPIAEVNDRVLVTDRTGNTSTYLVRGQAQPVGRGRLWSLDVQLIRAPR